VAEWASAALVDRESHPRRILTGGNRRPAPIIDPAQQAIQSATDQDLQVLIQRKRRWPTKVGVRA